MDEVKTFSGEVIPVFQPEDGQPTHVTVHGTAQDNLNDILALYEEDKKEFFRTPVADRKILEVRARWAQSAKELIQCAEGMIKMFGATFKDQNRALDLIDYANKDADMRKKTILRHIEYALKLEPDNTELYKELHDVRLACIHQVQAITNVQSTYTKWVKTGKNFEDAQQQERVESSYRAHRTRMCCPNHVYRPAFIYPKTVTPPGEPVPEWPDAFCAVDDVPPEEKVWNEELHELVLPEGYVSEDGRIDDHSVIWHPETHEVEIGYVGEPKEVWNYVRHINSRDVWVKGSWEADYLVRLYRQLEDKEKPKPILGR